MTDKRVLIVVIFFQVRLYLKRNVMEAILVRKISRECKQKMSFQNGNQGTKKTNL